jgi:hypothetical protein
MTIMRSRVGLTVTDGIAGDSSTSLMMCAGFWYFGLDGGRASAPNDKIESESSVAVTHNDRNG